MVNFNRFFRYIQDFFTESPSVSSPMTGGSGSKEIRINLYQTEKLTRNNGRAPEKSVALYLQNALEGAPYSFDIRFNFPEVDVSNEWSGCNNGVLPEWSDIINEDGFDPAKDSNVLLTYSGGGGCGYLGAKACTTPAHNLTELRHYERTGTDSWHRNMHANLHEVAHNLGARHDHDKERMGAQHPGKGWNENDYWHRTPEVAGNGARNACGEMIPEKENGRVMRHQYYHDCFLNEFIDVK